MEIGMSRDNTTRPPNKSNVSRRRWGLAELALKLDAAVQQRREGVAANIRPFAGHFKFYLPPTWH
jgi:hypothetical protein